MSGQTNRRDIRKINSYQDAEQYILNIPKFTGKNCMEDTRRFLEHLGNPSLDKKIIHVAGTNGKGSVCAYLCSVMRAAGISCAMFTSPHLVTMREWFVIDGEMISEEQFLRAFLRVGSALATMPQALRESSYHPTFFEYLFLWRWWYSGKRVWNISCWRPGLAGGLTRPML